MLNFSWNHWNKASVFPEQASAGNPNEPCTHYLTISSFPHYESVRCRKRGSEDTHIALLACKCGQLSSGFLPQRVCWSGPPCVCVIQHSRRQTGEMRCCELLFNNTRPIVNIMDAWRLQKSVWSSLSFCLSCSPVFPPRLPWWSCVPLFSLLLSLFHMLLIFLFFSSLFLSRELPQSLRENILLFLCAAAGISLI